MGVIALLSPGSELVEKACVCQRVVEFWKRKVMEKHRLSFLLNYGNTIIEKLVVFIAFWNYGREIVGEALLFIVCFHPGSDFFEKAVAFH